jgi:hypothetical protein
MPSGKPYRTKPGLSSPNYSPTREIDQRRPFWRPDHPQHNRIPGAS